MSNPVKTIVYIDDDLDDIAIFEDLLPMVNPAYILKTFSDSPTAIQYLDEALIKPDIIFLDINMPRMTGKETLMLTFGRNI